MCGHQLTLARGAAVLRSVVRTRPDQLDVGPRDSPLAKRALDDRRDRDVPRAAVIERPAHGASGRVAQHGRIGEEQFAVGVEQRHRVLEVLDRRLEIRLLAGERRPIGESCALDRVEERAQLAELVLLVADRA